MKKRQSGIRYIMGAGIGLALMTPWMVLANPVSYPGGTMVMLENSAFENNALVNYTLDPKTAVGYRIEYDRDNQSTFHGAQIDRLVKRWNNPDSQANIYVHGAVGVIDRPARAANAFEPAAQIGMQADWESRRYFTLYENHLMLSDEAQEQQFAQAVKLGIAPYVAEMGSLHTWLMMQFDHRPENPDTFTTTPLVRFFYNTYLLEAGYNIDTGAPMVNATLRF